MLNNPVELYYLEKESSKLEVGLPWDALRMKFYHLLSSLSVIVLTLPTLLFC